MYHDALCTLDNSVSNCMVSPPLMGSSGVMPLSVISVYVPLNLPAIISGDLSFSINILTRERI